MTVSVRVLKNQLSEYLRRVRAGERLIVTDRGRPIAELAPPPSSSLSPEERLDRFAQTGELRRARGAGLADIEPIKVRGRPLAETLLEDRG